MCHGLPVMKYRSHPTHVGDVMTAYTAAKISQLRQSLRTEPTQRSRRTDASYRFRRYDSGGSGASHKGSPAVLFTACIIAAHFQQSELSLFR